MSDMRHDFSPSTLDTLAKRVGYLCSRCRQLTVGPRQDANASVNIGVGAHITAASPGGPRYDQALSEAERRGLGNGVWLCQSCAKLVDNDPQRFPAAVLRALKERAEERARAALDSRSASQQSGPTLYLPAGPATGLWLSYVTQSTAFCGRDEEMRQLGSFLADERPFSWWLVTAPAGAGKSRLALELCLNVAAEWDTGFLSRSDPFTDWAHWEPTRPTLVVVDYVSGRSSAASDMALFLSRSSMLRSDNRVRLLLVEREASGSWWPEFQREASLSEGVSIAVSRYALPLRLNPLSDADLWSVTTDIAGLVGIPVQPGDRGARLAEAHRIDPGGRPLFAMIAASVPLSAGSKSSRDALLQTVLSREQARWKAFVPAEEERDRYVALLSYATVLGGLELHSRHEPLWSERLLPLLPDSHRVKEPLYRDIVGDYSSTVSLPSLQPDILGEFFVLERLRGSIGAQVTTHAILDAAWDADPESVSQFVRRAAADFWTHPSTHFLQDPVVRTPSQRDVWSLMVADLVGFGGQSDDPQLNANISALRNLAEAHPDEIRLQQHRARAEFNLGTLLLMENEYPAADSQLSTAIDLPTASPDTQGDALNNRGIARWHYQSKEAAFEDFSRVISLPGASNEVRACALNNRADIFFEDGDYEGAIRDRSAVLKLPDTTYNRRYIAHIRRCRAYLATGRRSEALDDLNAILATEDIALEQKMAARLKRAALLVSTDSNAALKDLTAVIESPANFAGTAAEALVARGKLFLEADDIGPAIQDFIATLNRADTNAEDVLTAHAGLGVAYAEIGETAEARAAWLFVRDHPRVSEEAREHADAVIASLK